MSTEDKDSPSSLPHRSRSVDVIESQRWMVMLGRTLPVIMGLMPVAEVIEDSTAATKLVPVAAVGVVLLAVTILRWRYPAVVTDPTAFRRNRLLHNVAWAIYAGMIVLSGMKPPYFTVLFMYFVSLHSVWNGVGASPQLWAVLGRKTK